ncbi:DUF262 domain-containing protein [Clostridium botulinum]|uniref:DUF262 domain-containing protein n=1 Tax=Clostridium botulinum TaxID=1491 RepID=A0A6M0SR31_CLOBO|nr:DUF262 domain-containing protein [Clostridium botulinum]
MNINENLINLSGFNPTKRTFQMTILKICEDIEKQEITLPLYQRDISWTTKQCLDLFNYQLLGKAPVAPISINEIRDIEENCIPQISFIEREIIEGDMRGKLSVTDGQQRLTSNFMTYINHPNLRNIFLDLVKGQFILLEDSVKKYQIPVGILLNKDNMIFFDYINNNSTLKKPECMNILIQVRNKLRDYSYTINMAQDLNEKEQIEWFEVLNNAGSKVTKIQMRFAKLKTEGIDIYKQYTKKFIDKIEEASSELGNDNLFKLKPTEVSIPIAALNPAYEVITKKPHTANYTPIPSDTRETQLCELESYELLACFKITLEALDKVMNFIKDNNLKFPDRIDYITYLLGYFVLNKNNVTDYKQIQMVIKWYKSVKFTNKSNSERRKIFTELLEIK